MSDDVVKDLTPSVKFLPNWESSFENNKRARWVMGGPCGEVAALAMYLRQLRLAPANAGSPRAVAAPSRQPPIGRVSLVRGSIDSSGGEDGVDLPVIGCVAHELIVLTRLHVDAAAGLASVHVALEHAELRVDVIVQHVAVAEQPGPFTGLGDRRDPKEVSGLSPLRSSRCSRQTGRLERTQRSGQSSP
jgi:hypothetical protein